MSDHVLKVEMGEFTNYHLTCNLDDAADCHQVCTTHPDGCDPMDVEGECVREVYRNGCTIAEWVNDGGIEAVGFEHTVEIPVTYQWNASHDYPSIHAASVPVLETPPTEAIFCDHSKWREAEGKLQAIKEMLAAGGHTAAYDLRRDINDILIGFSASVEPVPARRPHYFVQEEDEPVGARRLLVGVWRMHERVVRDGPA